MSLLSISIPKRVSSEEQDMLESPILIGQLGYFGTIST